MFFSFSFQKRAYFFKDVFVPEGMKMKTKEEKEFCHTIFVFYKKIKNNLFFVQNMIKLYNNFAILFCCCCCCCCQACVCALLGVGGVTITIVLYLCILFDVAVVENDDVAHVGCCCCYRFCTCYIVDAAVLSLAMSNGMSLRSFKLNLWGENVERRVRERIIEISSFIS